MIAALFGEDKVEAFLSAFKTATYDEFESAVKTLQAYIKEGTAGSVILSGQEFALAAEKTGKAASLEGVFSVAGSENGLMETTLLILRWMQFLKILKQRLKLQKRSWKLEKGLLKHMQKHWI